MTPRSKSISQQIIQTRQKNSSVLLNENLLSNLQKTIKTTTRRRRRTDPFTRMSQTKLKLTFFCRFNNQCIYISIYIYDFR